MLSELGSFGALGLLAMVVCFFLNWRESRKLAQTDPSRPLGNDFVYQLSRGLGINIVLIPLKHHSYVSMRKMQKLGPQIKRIQERYKKLKPTAIGK
ncbi:MAG: YidC/Oxa1 family membrane protein insertase [Sphingomonadales bacterium]|nr:YidC/Oxa1 family membrane protein insertase [Sphingomonadales bacterium]